MDAVILPVSNRDNNASVRVASDLFPARSIMIASPHRSQFIYHRMLAAVGHDEEVGRSGSSSPAATSSPRAGEKRK
jgi:hypothetical protein